MKKSTIYLTTLVLMIAFVLSSCDLVKDLLDINFDTSYKDIPFTVNPKNSGIYMFHKTYIQSDTTLNISQRAVPETIRFSNSCPHFL